MDIVTYSNQSPINNSCLKILLKNLNVELLPVISYDSFTFDHKLLSLRSYLEQKKDNDLILFVDAFDVLPVNKSSRETLEQAIYKKFDLTKITFNSEVNCYPDINYKTFFDKITTKWKYLNSGIFCGKVKILKPFLDNSLQNSLESCKGSLFDDQLFWIKEYVKNTSLFNLDYKCEIFQSLFSGQMFSEPDNELIINIGEKIFYNSITQSFPLLVHGNGKVRMDKFFEIVEDQKSPKPYAENLKIFNPEIIYINN